MRIGIVALLHESNTFVRQPTDLDRFREDMFLHGEAIRETLFDSHHEIGGFFAGIDSFKSEPAATAVPLVALRAVPSGTITSNAFSQLVDQVLTSVEAAAPLDGILVAPHGAAVSESHADADGFWLSELRRLVGPDVPIVGTLDSHANLSRQMVASCDALIAYRTNPHLDQRDRGREAAELIIATLRGDIRPTMAAAFPPLVINIERQCTDDAHWQPLFQLANAQLQHDSVLSNSLLLGFPYADVPEMGASALVVTDEDALLADRLAQELAAHVWCEREAMRGQLTSVQEALEQCEAHPDQRICLLDMGDNVGAGSAADGTTLLSELRSRQIGPAFVCLCDAESVAACHHVGVGRGLQIRAGGKTDNQHGPPLDMDVEVLALPVGRFREDQPRHGGIVEFDQGPTAIVRTTDGKLTLMLTTRRMVPFSLRQLTSFNLDPKHFRILVAKGVNAPIAAYREVCDTFIRVNTIGSTCADLSKLRFANRRNPLYPFEPQMVWNAADDTSE